MGESAVLATLPKVGKEWKVGLSIKPTGQSVHGWRLCLGMRNFLEILFYLDEGVYVTHIAVKIKRREEGWLTITRTLPQQLAVHTLRTRWFRVELEFCNNPMIGRCALRILIDRVLIGFTLENLQESVFEHENISMEIFDSGLMGSLKDVTVQTNI